MNDNISNKQSLFEKLNSLSDEEFYKERLKITNNYNTMLQCWVKRNDKEFNESILQQRLNRKVALATEIECENVTDNYRDNIQLNNIIKMQEQQLKRDNGMFMVHPESIVYV